MSNRLAKLPPDPEDIESLRRYRAHTAEIADIAMDIIRLAAPGAKAEAYCLAETQLAALDAMRAGSAPTLPEPETPRRLQAAPPPAAAPQPPAREAAALPRGEKSPTALIIACARLVRTCADLDARLSRAIAQAHTTAEQAGLHHPLRQPIADHLHEAARTAEQPQTDPAFHNQIDIAVTEELGRSPAQNPGDLIATLAWHFNLPANPETFPNGWRPSRPQKPPKDEEPYVPPDPNSPMGGLLKHLLRLSDEEFNEHFPPDDD